MNPRTSRIERTTGETSVVVDLTLDGSGRTTLATGVPFFDHMLDQLGRHGRLDLTVQASGDVEVDAHHTVEDVGIALGQALAEAWGDRAGVERFGEATVPLDECLARAALDLSGRPHLTYDVATPVELIGSYETTLSQHFFESLVAHARVTLHLHLLASGNSHHAHEAVFKACGVALRRAVARSGGADVPSTKGLLA